MSVVFHKWQFNTDRNTKKAAISYRDEILKELEDKRIFSISWTPNVTYFINGLGLEVNYKRICARTPNTKGLPQARRFNYKNFGLRKAFDMAISELEQHKRRAAYPEWVINKAWKLVEKSTY